MSAAAYIARALADGATSLWPFQETSGTVAEDVGPNGNDATHVGAEITVGADEGPCANVLSVRYDPANPITADSYTTVGDFAAYETTSFTLECWFRSAQVVLLVPILTKASEYLLTTGSAGTNLLGTVRNTASGAYLFAEATATFGEWHHGAVTLSGTTLSTYVDGELGATDTVPNGSRSTATANPLLIGASIPEAGTSFTFDGWLALPAYYPTALSAEQVLDHARALCTGGWTVGSMAIA